MLFLTIKNEKRQHQVSIFEKENCFFQHFHNFFKYLLLKKEKRQ